MSFTPDEEGNAALHRATINSDELFMRALLSRVDFPELNCPNEFGETPLHLAVRFNNPEAVKLLVANNAD